MGLEGMWEFTRDRGQYRKVSRPRFCASLSDAGKRKHASIR